MNQPSAPETAVAILHNGKHFSARVGDLEGLLDYCLEGECMVITRTSVPEALAGQGIAGKLTRAAFEHARGRGWKVRPACAYAAGWVERHPEYAPLLA